MMLLFPNFIKIFLIFLDFLEVYEIFEKSSLDKNFKILPSKWCFSYKQGRFKARLVVGGHKKIENVDFNVDDIYAPTLSLENLRFFNIYCN